MRTLWLEVAYDGTRYGGWQRQANADSIQGELEQAVFGITGERVTVHGAGRTDAGVHALAQSAHVRLEAASPPTGRLHLALDSLLPPDIRVLRAREVPPGFHARFSARAKRYLYRIRWGRVEHPIGRAYAWHCPRPLDLGSMRAAASLLVGTHDFRALATNPGHGFERPTVRTIHALHLGRRRDGVDLVVQGDGFLYNQVRTMAGSLVEVGRGRREPTWITSVLASRDRRQAGPTLPARGLFLVRVLYPCPDSMSGRTPPGEAGTGGDPDGPSDPDSR